jgi:iron complex outermembrane receptor protein
MAARYDKYSDFGSSTDPRVGLAWRPVQSLTLRGSWGTSYLAPKLRAFDVAFNSAFAVADYPAANGLHILQVNGNAAESLGPQQSDNYTIGLEWAPGFLPGARFAINYYDIEYTDRLDSIGGVSFATISADPSAYETAVIFDPTEAQVLEYIAYGTAGGRPFLAVNPDFTPNPDFQPGDVDLIVDARRRNIGVMKTNGFDVSASYDFDVLGSHVRVAVDGSWMEGLSKQITDSTTPIELEDTFANPTRRRVRGQLSFRNGGWTANAFVHYRNSYLDNRFLPFVTIDSHTTVDANVGYSFGDSAGLLSNSSIALSAINVFDEDPPPTRVRPSTGVFDLGFDPANASPLGRLLTLDLRKRW